MIKAASRADRGDKTVLRRRFAQAVTCGALTLSVGCTTGSVPPAAEGGRTAPDVALVAYMQKLRIEGWQQLAPFTKATSGLPSPSKWTPARTLLPDNSLTAGGMVTLKPDLRAEQQGPALWEASYFDETATTYVTTMKLNEWGTTDILRKKLSARGVEFPHGSQVIKTFWYKVGTTPVPVRVWNWNAIGGGLTEAPLDKLREVCVTRQPAQGCVRAEDAFYTATVQQQDLGNFTCGTRCKETLNAGDFLVLVGMHVATKVRPEWLWATFWWRDSEEEPRKPWPTGTSWTCVDAQRQEAIGRVTAPWSNYSMDVTASFKRPKPRVNMQEGCGEPANIGNGEQAVAMYNPFSEARFTYGLKSSCVHCHSWVSTNVKVKPEAQGRPRPPGTPFPQPTFSDQEDDIRLDYLWSLQRSLKRTYFPEEW